MAIRITYGIGGRRSTAYAYEIVPRESGGFSFVDAQTGQPTAISGSTPHKITEIDGFPPDIEVQPAGDLPLGAIRPDNGADTA